MNNALNTTLGEVCDFVGGSQPAKKFFINSKKEGYIRLIQIRDYKTDSYITFIPENSTRKFCNKTDIMIGRYGPPIFQILRGIEGAYNVALMKAIPKENIVNDYLYYFLCQEHLFDYINALSPRTGGQTGVDVVMLKKFPIRLPEISTQKQIAKVLSDLDTKIEINNKINKELEAIAKTLYDYWFVQFDFPDKNGKPYKSSGGKIVFNEELKREIPVGWESGTFETISTIIGGSTPSKAVTENFAKEDNMSWITPKDLSQNKGKKFITRGDWDVTNLGIKSASLKIMPKGTVLLSSRAPIGYLAVSRQEVTTNQGFKSFVPKENYSSEFIYYSVKNQIPKIEAYSSGSTFKEVSTSTLRTIKISIPNENVLEEYYKISKPIFKKQNLLELENQKLSELRDWLLPMLMNGQITVAETEKEENLQVAAEPTAIYKTQETNLSNLFPTLNYDYEIATIVWRTKQKLGKEFGKKYIQKTISNIQFLSTLPKIEGIVFKEYYWGMFSNAVEKAIQNKEFIKFKKIDFGREVIELNMKHLVNVSKWTKQEGYNKEFTEQVNQMLEIYNDSLIDSDMNRIELLNTVLECIKVLETYDFDLIYAKMKTWKMEEGYYKFKADKFKEGETELMIELVKKLKIKYS
ncbi:restriction endonuclease subunit S [Tenacibaculum aquimarinum]|uniref:restriction endonuclease subunit S n=1 Tax=Tenacibaculum aquimarinum TaxID=2910675 RepID=UPI001F0B50F1|nr:restriction endonuclease subunit S [Tenacibaculum aquimarinum]MCH3884389.1 restriction endonuclease subunit S [Tenacibaculum aquimarinum]